MYKALVDLGSNSAKMIVYDFKNNKEIYSARKVVRLGEGSFENHIITPEATKRCVDVLLEFIEIKNQWIEKNLSITATSCLRDAINQKEFINYIYKETGQKIRVISGEEEGKLVFNAVINDLDKNRKTLVMDIGGGSTELILGNKENIILVKSLELGAVRLHDMFFKSNSEKEAFDKACNYVKKVSKEVITEIKACGFDTFVGVSGTFTNIGNFIKNNLNQSNNIFFISDILDSLDKLLNMSIEERKKAKGINPDRADIICAGGAIIKTFSEELGLSALAISDVSLKEGLIWEIKENGNKNN